MNAKRAKSLRRRIYGEQSLGIERKYIYDVNLKEHVGGMMNKPDSLRAIYQAAKKRAI